jgi:RimJ/RimL family protein N-acetyltransferase
MAGVAPIEPPRPPLADGDIRLRPWTLGDLEAFRTACEDVEIARWTGFPFSLTPEAARGLIEERIASFQTGTSAAFVVVDAASDRVLGSVSLLWIDWASSLAQAAYWLAREERGRGVATRSLRLLTDWALGELGLAGVELTADVRNVKSHLVAERAGFRRHGIRRGSREIHGERIDEVVFRLGHARSR